MKSLALGLLQSFDLLDYLTIVGCVYLFIGGFLATHYRKHFCDMSALGRLLALAGVALLWPLGAVEAIQRAYRARVKRLDCETRRLDGGRI